MADLVLERHFPAPLELVFAYVTQTEHLVKWWGPEGMTLPDHSLTFDQEGSWHSVMMNSDRQTFKVSGHVTHVDLPSKEVAENHNSGWTSSLRKLETLAQS